MKQSGINFWKLPLSFFIFINRQFADDNLVTSRAFRSQFRSQMKVNNIWIKVTYFEIYYYYNIIAISCHERDMAAKAFKAWTLIELRPFWTNCFALYATFYNKIMTVYRSRAKNTWPSNAGYLWSLSYNNNFQINNYP